jgi:hypothetical protein
MPEIVANFIKKGTVGGLNEIYEEIWQSYSDDFEKYDRNLTQKNVLRHIIQTAAHEKDRITMGGVGNSNYKSREVNNLTYIIFPI